MKNKDMAKFFTVHVSFISMIKRNERDFTWEMSRRMENMLPEKDKFEWRKSSFDEWSERLDCLGNITTKLKK